METTKSSVQGEESLRRFFGVQVMTANIYSNFLELPIFVFPSFPTMKYEWLQPIRNDGKIDGKLSKLDIDRIIRFCYIYSLEPLTAWMYVEGDFTAYPISGNLMYISVFTNTMGKVVNLSYWNWPLAVLFPFLIYGIIYIYALIATLITTFTCLDIWIPVRSCWQKKHPYIHL